VNSVDMNNLRTLGLLLCVSACSPGTPVVQPIVDAGPNPCEGQGCSGHGTCAVVNGVDAVCVCRAGFFAEGLECRAIVAGAECDGVTCNGRGVCVVLSGMPNTPRCDCNADSVSAGATTCVAKPTPCAGVTCSGHGTCAVAGTMPVCVCEAGFRTGAGNTCEPVIVGQECQGIDCSGHGTCAVAGGAPLCSCEAGYDRLGTTCVPRAVTDAGAGPCAGVTCSGRGQCAVLGAATPVCVCNQGYVPSSLACVLQGTVGGDLTLLAGALGGAGSRDGSNARFTSPRYLTNDSAGNVYVVGQSVRKIAPDGGVTTIAGLEGPGNAAFVNDVGSAARFKAAKSPVVDSAGNLFVIDGFSIRKITPAGVVSTFAGSALGTASGDTDGTGTAARFSIYTIAMTIDANDNLWVSARCPPNLKLCLRKITSGAVVTSLLASIDKFPGVLTISADGSKVFMAADADVSSIDTTTGALIAVVSLTTATSPPGYVVDFQGICRDASNTLWLADAYYNRLLKVPTTGGTPTLVAGSNAYPVQAPANLDGPGTSARFFRPWGISCNQPAGKVYVADQVNHTIRAISTSGTNVVTTIAGTPIVQGAVDGAAGAARFRFPTQVVADSAGNWFVSDTGNAVIRKVAPSGAVSVFAGTFGTPGSSNGTGTAARFSSPACFEGGGCYGLGLAIDSSDNLYVADRGNRAIRRITPAGAVTTLASGTALAPATMSPNADQFMSIAVDSANGDVYFDAIDGIRRLRGSASTVVVPFSFSRSPRSVAVDSTRRKLFVALESSERADVQRYDLAGATPVLELTLGNVTPLVGGYYAPDPGQLAVAPNGALVITYPETHVVRRIDPGFSRVDTIAGAQEAVGVELGPLPARLNNPTGVAFNASGQFAIIMGQAGTTNRGFGEGALLVTTGFTP
jgi:hypothetical protein